MDRYKNLLLKLTDGARLIVLACFTGILSFTAQAQDQAQLEEIEEVVVVGSQIRGAKISEALAVSVFTAEDIELFGVDSGDELFDLIPENGQNFHSEAENISGGVNSARGDIGAFNLRNIGTGNTLVLLNGRRLVNAASFQTEEVGGSFVPVNSVNSNTLPVFGIERVEILRDGASAIYGADAVAGVINTVLKKDLDGFKIALRRSEYDNLPRADNSLRLEWGQFFSGGATNLGIFFNYYDRGRVNSQDDPRWADADFRSRIPEGSPFAGNTNFRNNSANSIYGQFDIIPGVPASSIFRMPVLGRDTRAGFVDSGGEFHIYPVDNSSCGYGINEQVCGEQDGGSLTRYNLNANRDLASKLERYNLFAYVNHTFSNGMESFTEISAYLSQTNLNRHPSAPFSSVRLRIAADAYYNPFRQGSPNNFTSGTASTAAAVTPLPANGYAVLIDNYRFTEVPRIVDNEGTTYRFLQGLRGDLGDWDFETAVLWSQANKDDVTHNRISNTLIQAAINSTMQSTAYNPFNGGDLAGLRSALVSVYRNSKAELALWDVKFSNNELFSLPGGDAGVLVGMEWRSESFDDDRDPLLDGTIRYTDGDGDTYPFVSDVVNSSPTPDNKGNRTVLSLFGEIALPLLSNLDVQLALRYEDFSDVSNTLVGKLAVGYRPADILLLRGSYSQAYRAPNLVTINENMIARSNNVTDYLCRYVNDNRGTADEIDDDCRDTAQRTAQGSRSLVSEESDNASLGFVLDVVDGLTMTADVWSIDKENTIGLFGEENHTTLELLRSIRNGNTNCDNAALFNPAVQRMPVEEDARAAFMAAGLCPVGLLERVNDLYANLNDRLLGGFDIGVYGDWEGRAGRFAIKYNLSRLTKFEQAASGEAAELAAAQNAGTLPMSIDIEGLGDLVGRNGNQDIKQSMRFSWRRGSFGAALGWNYLGSFYQSSLTLANGTRWVVPAFETYDLTFDYYFRLGTDSKLRTRLGVKNMTDERAPLADRFFGFFADAHRDYGRYVYLDIRATL